MADRCKFNVLVVVSALVSGEEPIEVPPCEADPVYLAVLATEDDGFAVEITTPVCTEHDVYVSQVPAHKRSIKLRQRTTT